MANIKSLTSISTPGENPRYPKTGRKKKDDSIMDKANRRSENLLGKPRSLSVTKTRVKMPKSSRY